MLGLNILKGNGFTTVEEGQEYVPEACRLPGYPLFLALVYRIFGISSKAVFLLQAVIYGITSLMLFKTARFYFSEKVALLSGYIFALYPFSVYWVGVLYSDTLNNLLIVCTFYFFIRGIKQKNNYNYFISGLFLGLAILTRPIGIFISLFLVMAMLVLRLTPRLMIRKTIYIFVASAIVLSPWWYWNHKNFNEFVLTSKTPSLGWTLFVSSWEFKDNWKNFGLRCEENVGYKEQLMLATTEGGSPGNPGTLGADRALMKAAIRNILNSPWNFIAAMLVRIPRQWNALYNPVFPGYILIASFVVSLTYFFLGSYGILVTRRRWRELFPVILPLIYYTVINVPLSTNSRWTLPGRPYLIIFVTVAVFSLINKAKGRKNDFYTSKK